MSNARFHSIKFSNNGTRILVSTDLNYSLLLNADTCKLENTLGGYQNPMRLKFDGCFSPDGKYVFVGSQDGSIGIWQSINGMNVCRLEGHVDSPLLVEHNPRFQMFASSDSSLAFWIPPF